MRCSSVAKTSIGLPGCFAASSATHSRVFFKCRRFFGRGQFRVLRTWLLDRPADRLQRFPAPLRGDRGEVEFASHPSRNLAARPQPAIGRRVVKAQAQFGEQVGLQDRCRCAVATAQVAKGLGSLGIVAGEQLFDPSLAIGRRPRHLRDGVTTRQKPDYLEVPRCGGILTSDKPLFQLLDTQMIPDRRHVSQSPNSWRLSLSASQGRVNPLQRRVNQPETVLLTVFPCYIRKIRQFSPLVERSPVNIFSSSVVFSVGYGVFPLMQELRSFLRKTGIFF